MTEQEQHDALHEELADDGLQHPLVHEGGGPAPTYDTNENADAKADIVQPSANAHPRRRTTTPVRVRSVDQIEQRVAVNESLFRDVNKNIHRGAADGRHPEAHFICECGERDCEEKIPLPIDTYESVRQSDLRFFVKPGHEIPYAESVIERHDRYLVIEKPPKTLPIVGED